MRAPRIHVLAPVALVSFFLIAAAARLTPPAAAASRAGFTMEVLVDGRPLAELPHGGKRYVEARRGKDYAVRLTNHTGERVAVALSVDGLNSIDAKRASARESTKWILGPWQSIVVQGWQTSGSTARRFFFTTEERSYGAWLGKTDDLGVVSAAFFRERTPLAIHEDWEERSDLRRSAPESPQARERDASGAPSAAAPAPESRAEGSGERQAKVSDDLAATGIGREIDHRVRRIDFDEEEAPAAVLSVRYEYRDALVRLGVLPCGPRHEDPLARRERADGFEDAGYAPDPYRRRR